MSEREFSVCHAHNAYRVYKDWMCTLPGFNVVFGGYRFDDDNGVSVFLSYEGKVRGTSS